MMCRTLDKFAYPQYLLPDMMYKHRDFRSSCDSLHLHRMHSSTCKREELDLVLTLTLPKD